MTKTIAMIFGVVYTAVGVLGFVPAFGGSASMTSSALFGIADVNLLHNIVHLVIGIAGLTMARTDEGAGTYCKSFGVILLIVGVVGFFAPNFLGILPIGGADVWIHLISGAILAYAGYMMKPAGAAA